MAREGDGWVGGGARSAYVREIPSLVNLDQNKKVSLTKAVRNHFIV